MRKNFTAILLGALIAIPPVLWAFHRHAERVTPPAPLYIDSLRELAKLEAFEVEMHQLVTFEPDIPVTDTLGQSVVAWMKDLVAHEKGTAMVFATARYAVDLRRFDASSLVIQDRTVFVRLPPIQVDISLKPEETLVLRSSLSMGGETAMLAKASHSFAAQARSNSELNRRARLAAERAIRDLCLRLGYAAVEFEGLPAS
jgi:hypothetical protein